MPAAALYPVHVTSADMTAANGNDDYDAAPDAPRASGEGSPLSASDDAAGGARPPRRSYMQKLAHELKTPVSAIAAASEIMRDEQLGPIGDERYRQYAADIHDSARLMLAIIDRMLAQRGREQGREVLAFAELEPSQVLHETVSSLLPLARRAGVKLRLVEPAGTQPRFIADLLTVKQILLNLLTNALKFTPEGGQVTVTARYDGDGPLVIEVRDTGPGMSEEEITAALGGQVAAGRERTGGGLGLGLPLVAALAQSNGAQFALTSRPGEGTSAQLIVPKDRLILI